MSGERGAIGARTGGKGSWRRKVKRSGVSKGQEGEKIWMAAQRLGCRNIGEIDTASIIVNGQEKAISFTKPELAIEMRANTYVLHGEAQEKPLAEVFADMLGGLDLSKFAKTEDAAADLGEVAEDVDFAKAEETA